MLELISENEEALIRQSGGERHFTQKEPVQRPCGWREPRAFEELKETKEVVVQSSREREVQDEVREVVRSQIIREQHVQTLPINPQVGSILWGKHTRKFKNR